GMQGAGQVLDGALFDIPGAEEAVRAAIRELHRVERRLQRPGYVVDEAPLVAADDLGALGDLQADGHVRGGLLDLDLDRAGRGFPLRLGDLGQVTSALVAAHAGRG